MQEKLAMVGDVHAKVQELESEKEEMSKALKDSGEINQQLKALLGEKDKVIERMQVEMEKFVAIKAEIEPIFKEAVEARKTLVVKDQEIDMLKNELSEAIKVVEELPKIEAYVKQASDSIKEMGQENTALKIELEATHKENQQLRAAQEEFQTSLKKFSHKDEEIRKMFDSFEQALKTLSQENTELKDQMLSLNKENEDFKKLTERFKGEYSRLQREHAVVIDERNRSNEEIARLKLQPKQPSVAMRPSTTTTDPGVRESKRISERAKESTKKIKNRDVIVEARDSSEDSSHRDQSSVYSQEAAYFSESKNLSHRPGSKRTKLSSGESKNLDILKASNKLLQEQNETLRIKALLMEERKKMEKDDVSKVD